MIPENIKPTQPIFASFMQAGFECTYALPKDKPRLDVLAATQHDVCFREDYGLILDVGMRTVREGLAWSQIDKGNGQYDFSRFLPMLGAARELGIQQIWDLNHFDYPDDLDFFSPEFIRRYTEYALRAHEVLRKYIEGPLFIVPFNEISFFSWVAGQESWWAPFGNGRGDACKRQLIRAAIAAMRALKLRDPGVRFIHTDPVMYRKALDADDQGAVEFAQNFMEHRYDSWDMIAGKLEPELGGDPTFLDILGANYYYPNQEWIIKDPKDKTKYTGWGMHWEHKDRVSFTSLLQEVCDRYQRPIVISETGSHGILREQWWIRTFAEIELAMQTVPIFGVCAYPVVDYPDWIASHMTNSGLWDSEPNSSTCSRIPHPESITLVKEFANRWQGSLQVPPAKVSESLR